MSASEEEMRAINGEDASMLGADDAPLQSNGYWPSASPPAEEAAPAAPAALAAPDPPKRKRGRPPKGEVAMPRWVKKPPQPKRPPAPSRPPAIPVEGPKRKRGRPFKGTAPAHPPPIPRERSTRIASRAEEEKKAEQEQAKRLGPYAAFKTMYTPDGRGFKRAGSSPCAQTPLTHATLPAHIRKALTANAHWPPTILPDDHAMPPRFPEIHCWVRWRRWKPKYERRLRMRVKEWRQDDENSYRGGCAKGEAAQEQEMEGVVVGEAQSEAKGEGHNSTAGNAGDAGDAQSFALGEAQSSIATGSTSTPTSAPAQSSTTGEAGSSAASGPTSISTSAPAAPPRPPAWHAPWLSTISLENSLKIPFRVHPKHARQNYSGLVRAQWRARRTAVARAKARAAAAKRETGGGEMRGRGGKGRGRGLDLRDLWVRAVEREMRSAETKDSSDNADNAEPSALRRRAPLVLRRNVRRGKEHEEELQRAATARAQAAGGGGGVDDTSTDLSITGTTTTLQ